MPLPFDLFSDLHPAAERAGIDISTLDPTSWDAVIQVAEQISAVARSARSDLVLALLASGFRVSEIARAMGTTVATIRSIHRARDVVAGNPTIGWEARTRELFARGLSADEIATETGVKRRTVYNRCHELGLSFRRRNEAGERR